EAVHLQVERIERPAAKAGAHRAAFLGVQFAEPAEHRAPPFATLARSGTGAAKTRSAREPFAELSTQYDRGRFSGLLRKCKPASKNFTSFEAVEVKSARGFRIGASEFFTIRFCTTLFQSKNLADRNVVRAWHVIC